MTKYLYGAAAIALFAANPASAQLLGGATGGLGGTIGGATGGLSGSGMGTLGSRIGRDPISTDTVTRTTGSARVDRSVHPRKGQADVTGAVTGQTSLSNSVNAAGRPLNTNGAVSGQANGRVGLDGELLQTRGAAAATRRGLRQVTATASGVPVFVSRTAEVGSAVAVPNAYPVFNSRVYYGGSDVVLIPSSQVYSYMDVQYRDLQRGMVGTGARVFRRGNDVVVQLPADVTFAFDRADIRPQFVRPLAAIARTLSTYRGTDVEISGHTDSIGSDSYNLGLSERRGRAVADFLVAREASPDRLVVEAMGESQPVASNASASGRAANRRVEIVFHPRSA